MDGKVSDVQEHGTDREDNKIRRWIMGKGLGIAVLVVAVVAIIVPIFGIYLGIITALLGIAVAALRERALAVAIGALNILNAVFLTPLCRWRPRAQSLRARPPG
jgi:uncharacterized membrane protein